MDKALIQYIKHKLSKYVAPERKGTAKGDPIGLSFVKYKATLLALHCADLKTDAQELNVSYSLLRKWRSETPFKEMVEKHRLEFTRWFFRFMLTKYREAKTEENKLLEKTPFSEIETGSFKRRPNYEEITDYPSYSKPLQKNIFDTINLIIKGQVDKICKEGVVHNQDEFMELLFAVFEYFKVVSPKFNEMLATLEEGAKKPLKKHIADVLARPDATEFERKDAIYWLSKL